MKEIKNSEWKHIFKCPRLYLDHLEQIERLFRSLDTKKHNQSLKINCNTRRKSFALDEIKELKELKKQEILGIRFSFGLWDMKLVLENDSIIWFDHSLYLEVRDSSNTIKMGIASQIQQIISRQERKWLFFIYKLFSFPFLMAFYLLLFATILLFSLIRIFHYIPNKSDIGLLLMFCGGMVYCIYKIIYRLFPSVIIKNIYREDEIPFAKKISPHIIDVLKNVIGGIILIGIGYYLGVRK